MKNKIIIFAIISFFIFVSLAFFINASMLEALRNVFAIISGTASFITVVLAVLLYNKYGIEKTIIEKNLDISLKLLEEIKKIEITFTGSNFTVYYRPATWSFEYFEAHYHIKLLFANTIVNDLENIALYSNNLYLPKEIKKKVDKILPYMLSYNTDIPNISEYVDNPD